MLNVTQVMDELKALGTEQNCKVYKRHGVQIEIFGVSYAHLGKLTKKIKVNHALAQQLWATHNHDARILALMIADPQQATPVLLDEWAQDLGNYVITDAFSGYAAKTPFAREKMEQWTTSPDEWIGAVGWNLLAYLAKDAPSLPDAFFEGYLTTIERDLHTSQNRVRHAMNNALIAIGTRNDDLEHQALAAAKRLGKVVVDHGETGCKTPAAAAYIQKIKARRK